MLALPFTAVVWLETAIAENNKNVIASLRRVRRRRFSITSILSVLPAFLLGLIIFAVLLSLVLTAHLLDNLKPGQYLNLFVQLVLWRWFLYFALAAECLVWYQLTVHEMKIKIAGDNKISVKEQANITVQS